MRKIQKQSRDTEKPSLLKRFLNHPLAIPFFIFLAYAIIVSCINYIPPKPLVKGFDYVGRNYDSGCVPSFMKEFMCYSSGRDEYFYSTDIPPEKIIDSFPQWWLKDTSIYYDADFDVTNVTIWKNDSNSISFDYYKGNPRFIDLALILPSFKKYTVRIYAQHAEQLHLESIK